MPNDARLSKWGNSLAVKIPQTIIKGDGSIVLRSGRPTYSLKQLVRGIKPQIKDRASKLDSKAGPTAKALDDLDKSLSAVEGEIYQVKNQSGQDPLNYPIKLNNKIAALQGVIESADDPPTDQSYEVFEMLSTRLGAQLAALDNTVKTRLPQVNQLLQKQKLAPIKAEPFKTDEQRPKSEPQ